MNKWVSKLGGGAAFIIIMAVITYLLHALSDGQPELVAALHNLYYIPILIAALLMGEAGGVIIALIAAVAASIATFGFSWPPTLLDWTIVGIRASFFLTISFLAARLAERVRSNAREWHSLLEISSAINSSLDLNETLETITRRSVELTSADACAIRLLRAEDEEMIYAKTAGLSDEYLSKGPLLLRDSLLAQRAMAGEDTIIPDIRKFPGLFYRDEAIAEGIVSIMSLPLRAGDELIGVLNLYRKRPTMPGNSKVAAQFSSVVQTVFQRRFTGFTVRDQRVARAFAEQAAIAIQNARLFDSIRSNYLETVRALTRAIEAKDPSTLGHSERVSELTLGIARFLRLAQAELEAIEFGALLHDIGKIGLDEQTLAKSGRLSLDEQVLMEMHPLIGKSIIEPVEFLRSSLPVVLSHHERWDGAGYPEGLKGTDIPLLARIVGIADALDHLMYQSSPTPLTEDAAFAELKEEAGTRFDPRLIEVLGILLQRKREGL